MRFMSTVVFTLPAPASISSGPSVAKTASLLHGVQVLEITAHNGFARFYVVFFKISHHVSDFITKRATFNGLNDDCPDIYPRRHAHIV